MYGSVIKMVSLCDGDGDGSALEKDEDWPARPASSLPLPLQIPQVYSHFHLPHYLQFPKTHSPPPSPIPNPPPPEPPKPSSPATPPSALPGVCITTNLVSGLADALLDSVLIVAITGQVPRRMIGTDAFQETPIVEIRGTYVTGIPVASTLMGLGSYPCSDELSLPMLGMHGTVYANFAVDRSDLLFALAFRFDDHVTGKLEAFASQAKIVHIDIDSAEIGKNKQPHVSVYADVKLALRCLNEVLEAKRDDLKLEFSAWREELKEQKMKYPLCYQTFGDAIPPQHAIQVLDKLTNGNAIITEAVADLWWIGGYGFWIAAAIGDAVARPNAVVVDINGDGSFIMHVQELATIRVENLPLKIMLLNNQHLEACEIPAAHVMKKGDLRAAIQKMLDTPGPYLLDVVVPHQEHVMIPSVGAFKDVITEGDGRSTY
ncbi:hypothetical protein TEA_004584 [Camellia sinensis var. sinensis]|uniref:acetolactate synthase n=1 Tax=Camellia sinensis var. sinensis TaxID=542762 RepID=A0A4S4DHH8_CAMSN|nr:hypothetical protein TEA_004584 [Camellia sinensis var. sinensis]